MKEKITNYILVISLIIIGLPFGMHACSCKAKPEPSVMDMNDSELIFTATLLEYKIGMSAGSLKFRIRNLYKGILEDTIYIYFKPQNTHLLFNKDVRFREASDWIIFARKKTVGNKSYYRLIEVEGFEFCALSRPIDEHPEKDAYLNFMNKMYKQDDGLLKMYDSTNVLIAQGFYKDNYPVAVWEYVEPNRKLKLSGSYQSGNKEGEWLKYMQFSGGEFILVQKRFYSQGILTEIHDLDNSGTVTFKKMLSDSTEVRHYFYESGNIKSITSKNKDNGTLKTATFYPSGGINEEKYFEDNKLMARYQFDENGLKLSEWIREEN